MKLNGFQLKMIAAFLMVIDHVYEFIPGTPTYCNQLGRVVAPIFLFLAVEGFHYTRDRMAYIRRLLLAGAGMFLGSYLLVLWFPSADGIPNNIFFSIGLSLAFLHGMELFREKDKLTRAVAFMAFSFIGLAFAEGSYMILWIVLIFYQHRENRTMMSIGFVIISFVVALLLTDFKLSLEVLIFEEYQWMMVFALPLIWLYDGKKGRGWKYFFYLFYPVHIWILYLISVQFY